MKNTGMILFALLPVSIILLSSLMLMSACVPLAAEENLPSGEPSASNTSVPASASIQPELSPSAAVSDLKIVDRMEDVTPDCRYTDEGGTATRWKVAEILVNEFMQRMEQSDNSRSFRITDYTVIKYIVDQKSPQLADLCVTLENLWYLEYAVIASYEGKYAPDEIRDPRVLYGRDCPPQAYGYVTIVVEGFYIAREGDTYILMKEEEAEAFARTQPPAPSSEMPTPGEGSPEASQPMYIEEGDYATIQQVPKYYQYTDEAGSKSLLEIADILTRECVEDLKKPDEKRAFTITDYDIIGYDLHYYNDHNGFQYWTVSLNKNLVFVQSHILFHYTGLYSPIGPPTSIANGGPYGDGTGYCYIEIDGNTYTLIDEQTAMDKYMDED